MPDLRLGKTIQDRRETMQKQGDILYHQGFYGAPCKRAASKEYKENFDGIEWSLKCSKEK